MKCEMMEEKISLYIDKQLDLQEEQELMAHIQNCPQCKEKLKQAQQFRDFLLELPMEEVPEGLHEDILAAIQKEVHRNITPLSDHKKKQKKTILWYRYGAVAACFVLLAATGNYIYHAMEQKHAVTEQFMGKMSSEANISEETISEKTISEANFNVVSMPIPIEETKIEGTEIEETEIEEAKIEETKGETVQKNVSTAPQTAKALPATPKIGTEQEEKETGSETISDDGTHQPKTATEKTQQNTEEQKQISSDVSSDISSDAEKTQEEQKPMLMQAKVTALEQEQTEQEQTQSHTFDTIGNDTIGNDTIGKNTIRKMPKNMKSKSMNISLKTTDAQKLVQKIEEKTKDHRGIIQTEYKEGSMQIQIPLYNYEDMLNWLKKQAEVLQEEEVVEDLSKQYKQIQKKAEEAEKIANEAEEKGETKKAKEARKIVQQSDAALKELEHTAEFAIIEVSIIEK